MKQRSKNVSRSDSKEFCIDPACFLSIRWIKEEAVSFFLRSFSPLSYYQETLGGQKVSLKPAESFSRRKPASFHRKLLRDDLSKKGNKVWHN